MSDKNEVNLFILKVGAVIGLSFAATIFIAHLRGICHTPGDNVSWLNIIIFSFVVMLSGRQYRETVEGEKFNYGRALLYVSKLNVISATVLAVFGYFYYNESLSGGSMAFVMFIMQLIGAGFFSLILANIIKTKPLLQINNLNQ